MTLPLSKDPLGQAVLDFAKNKKAGNLWVYSDISEKDEIPVEYLFRDYQNMPNIEQEALKLSSGKILDIGAAAGSHALHIQKQLKNVTAIDISKKAVQAMKIRGVKNTVLSNFFDYQPKQKFDTLLFLMNGIGIAGTLNELGKFFIKCKDLMSPKGQILVDSSDLSYLYDTEDDKPSDHYFGEVRYVMNYDEIISDAFNWLFIDFEKLKNEAAKYGLNCEKIANGNHYDYLAKLTRQ